MNKREKERLLWIEAESFDHPGGWVVDQQFMKTMGSAYLLAHGFGNPVKDAVTAIDVPESKEYRVWVRTKEWSGRGQKEDAPGKFQLLIGGKPCAPVFGIGSPKWHWADGGMVSLEQGKATLTLHDLTGFEGRCDAIVLSGDPDLRLPEGGEQLAALRRKALGLDKQEIPRKHYDLVVAGGGIAGICAAVGAARLGLMVALIHDRPVVGGNNSTEVRVQLGGFTNLSPYPELGNVVKDLDPHFRQNARRAHYYKDELKMSVVKNEPNLDLYLSHSVVQAKMNDAGQIGSVIAQSVLTGRQVECGAGLFADCTGDANLGFLAGAAFMVGRESRSFARETLAPKKADMLTMGSSVMWYSSVRKKESVFPRLPWAVQFNEKTYQKVIRGDWNWELGLGKDQIAEAEQIRDYGFKVIYGNWDYLKNSSAEKEEYRKRKLEWVSYIAGKRESRRLIGDLILTQHDVESGEQKEDGCIISTWPIDLHYPIIQPGFKGEPFRTTARKKWITPFTIPYRCLYSKNITNLFMAGRNISVTHVALGTVRVMKTTGMMGEVIGIAASLCKKKQIKPREIYTNYLKQFTQMLNKGIPQKSTDYENK
jgi:hypothetical protein